MTNELRQSGVGNIGLQDVRDSTVNITQIPAKYEEYEELLNDLETQRDLLTYLPKDQIEKRLRTSQKVVELETRIEQFKKVVLQLAEGFSCIEINTDRLRRAKAHFDKGEIAAARAVFDSEHEQMQSENNRLVREKERYEKDTLSQLKHNADEYYLRALLERTAYDNPHWLEGTCEYFEHSINAQATEDNVFHYALFLQNHNRFQQAEAYYQKYLVEFVGDDDLKRAKTLNNLAASLRSQDKLAEAETKYTEALDIYRKLASFNPDANLPNVATTLNNFGVLLYTNNKLAKAKTRLTEALEIRRKLAAAAVNQYLPHVADTLNNLATTNIALDKLDEAADNYAEALKIYQARVADNLFVYLPNVAVILNNQAALLYKKCNLTEAVVKYADSLEIRRELASNNPAAYLPTVATTLNNLAVIHTEMNKLDELAKAKDEYAEALTINRHLASITPSTYLPSVAATLNNLALLHNKINEPAKAKDKFVEALDIYRQLAVVNPSAYLPDVAMTLINLAAHHYQSEPNKQLSVSYSLEAITLIQPIVEAVPYTQSYLNSAIELLQQGWGLSQGENIKMLTKTGTENQNKKISLR